MASWGSRSPRGRSRIFRDNSPTSPLTPLSPSAFPQWFRSTTRPRAGLASSARVKTVLLAIACLSLGWLLTSTLGASDEGAEEVSLNTAAGEVLTDPSGFGLPAESKQHGIIGSHEEYESSKNTEMGKPPEPAATEPSVKGALKDLKHAMSDRIQQWNPYHAKPPKGYGAGQANATTPGIDGSHNHTKLPQGGEDVQDGIKAEESLGARTRVGKVTIMFYGNGFWERCIKTHEHHDKTNGYRLHILRQQLFDDVWSKPAYILSLLLRELSKPESERLEWLLWVDADTVILNPLIPIETFLPPPGSEFDDVHLMYSNDWNGLNNGVFPIRVNQWAADLFASIVSYRQWNPEDPLTFRDQSAMGALLQKPEFAPHVVQAPQRWFNAYQGEHNETLQPFQIRRGDLLVHFAGVPDREARMAYWLERAEQHLDDWEIPVKSTSYPQEARDFWNEQRELRRNKKEALQAARARAGTLVTQTEQKLKDYGDRLTEEQKAALTDQNEALKQMLADEASNTDPEKWEETMTAVTEAANGLSVVIAEANKSLLQSAHAAIFGGEKDLMEAGYSEGGSSSPQLEQVSSTIKHLKNLVMTSEEFWSRQDISAATNAVTDARAKLLDSNAAQLAAQQQAHAEQSSRAKALAEAKKVAEAEASGGAGNGTAKNGTDASSKSDPVAVDYGVAEGSLDQASSDEAEGEVAESVVPVTITHPGPIEYATILVTAVAEMTTTAAVDEQ